MKEYRILALTLLASLLLAACGGGGGGGAANTNSGSTPPPANPTPDPDPDPDPEPEPLPFDLLSDAPGSPVINGYINDPDIVVAFDDAGNGVATWVVDTDTDAVLRYSIFTAATGSWSSPEDALELRDDRSEVQVVSGGTSFAVLVLDGEDAALVAVVANGVLSDFATLDVLTEEENNQGFAIRGGGLAASGEGYAATWERVVRRDLDTFDSFFEIRASTTSQPGAGWSDPVSLNDEAILGTVDLLGTANGYLQLWFEFEEVNNVGVSRIKISYNDGSGWVTDDLGQLGATFPVAATNGTTFQIAWVNGDNTRIFSKFYDSNFVLSSNTVSFTQSFARNLRMTSDGNDYLLSWQTSVDHYVSIGRDSSFTAAQQITNANSFDNNKVLAGEAGKFVMAWTQDSGIWAAIYDGNWSVASPVTEPGVELARVPSIVLEDGTATLVWQQITDPEDRIADIYASTAVSSWSAPELVDAGTRSAAEPVLSSGGDLFLHWVQQLEDNSGVGVFAARNAGSWGEPELLNPREADSSVGSSVRSSTILSNEAGEAFAIWSQREGTQFTTYGAIRSAEGEWGSPEILDTRVTTFRSSLITDRRVATNGGSFAYVYTETEPSPDDEADLFVRIYENGSWSEPTQLDIGLTLRLQDFTIASNGTGYLVAWTQATSDAIFGDQRTYGSLYEDGSWSMPALLSDGTASSTQAPYIASNGTGYAVTWEDFRSDEIQVNVYDGSAWSGAQTLLTGIGSQAISQVESDGVGYMVWWFNVAPTEQFANLHVSLSTTGAADDFWEGTRVTPDEERRPNRRVAAGGPAGYAVAWTNEVRSSGQRDVVAVVWDGSRFTDVTSIEAVDTEAFILDVAASDSGFAVLIESRDSAESLNPRSLSATVYADGAWQDNVPLEASDQPLGDRTVSQRAYVTGSADSFAAIWSEQSDDDFYHIRFSHFDGTSWNTQQIEEQAANADDPRITANADGTFTVLWRQPDPDGSPFVRFPWAYSGLE